MFLEIISILTIVYIVLDIDVFLVVRVILTYVAAKWYRSKIGILESSEVYGICLPSDADLRQAQQNSFRYLREYGLADFDLMLRNGVMNELLRHGGTFPFAIAAICIRYRRPIRVFSTYKIVTTPIYWDEQFFYLDQRIITLSDNITCTTGFVKLAIAKLNVEELVQKLHPGTVKPEIPEELRIWIESLELSREYLKSEAVLPLLQV